MVLTVLTTAATIEQVSHRRVGVDGAAQRGFAFYGYGGSDCKSEFLGRARIHADRGSGHLALRRQYALPGAGSTGRHALHTGLRDGAAHARQPLDRTKRGEKPGNTHPDHSLPLGSYSGSSVFCPALRGAERI